jgi:hypothetical protein
VAEEASGILRGDAVEGGAKRLFQCRTMDATMTTDTMDLQTLLEKTTDPDFLRHMIGFSAWLESGSHATPS